MQFMRAYHWQCLHITFDFSPPFALCAGTARKRAGELIRGDFKYYYADFVRKWGTPPPLVFGFLEGQ